MALKTPGVRDMIWLTMVDRSGCDKIVARIARRPDRPSRGISSAGRALAWHARGQGFKSPILHYGFTAKAQDGGRSGDQEKNRHHNRGQRSVVVARLRFTAQLTGETWPCRGKMRKLRMCGLRAPSATAAAAGSATRNSLSVRDLITCDLSSVYWSHRSTWTMP